MTTINVTTPDDSRQNLQRFRIIDKSGEAHPKDVMSAPQLPMFGSPYPGSCELRCVETAVTPLDLYNWEVLVTYK
jgi:hypothetical protein